MRLLLDEQLDKALAEQLRGRGHDVLAVTEEPALKGVADEALLEWALAQRRVLVSYNIRHFMPLIGHRLVTEEPFWGVVLVAGRKFPQGKRPFGRLLRALKALLAGHPEEDALRNRYVWL